MPLGQVSRVERERLLGVARPYRRGTVALALLRRALDGIVPDTASFTTHTGWPALQRRLRRLGATQSGGFVYLRRDKSIS